MITNHPGYLHHGLFYDHFDDLAVSAMPFLQAGLDNGHAVVLACRAEVNAALMDALGPDPPVLVLDRQEIYTRIAVAVGTYQRMVHRQLGAGATQVWLLGEVDYGDSAELWVQWGRFESVCNAALRTSPLTSVCAYDTRYLPDPVRDNIMRTHPRLLSRAGATVNDRYVEPRDFLREVPEVAEHPVQESPPASELSLPPSASLSSLRSHMLNALQERAVPRPTAEEFIWAVNEVAANGVVHGLPPVTAKLWAGVDVLLATVTDYGPGFDDPLAGFVEDVSGGRLSGRGLWLARQMCDSLTMSHSDEGFTVRLQTALDGTAPDDYEEFQRYALDPARGRKRAARLRARFQRGEL